MEKTISSQTLANPMMKVNQPVIRSILFVLLLVIFVGTLFILVFFDPGEMIEKIGIGNSFIIAFFVSVAGAFTSMTKFSTYPMIITLVAGHVDPLAAGLVTGIGNTFGDILFYAFGSSARGLTSEKVNKKLEKILRWMTRLREIYIQIIIFLYLAITPFPNNMLSGALAFIGYPLKKAIVPLVLGDITFCILIAWLAFRGIDLM